MFRNRRPWPASIRPGRRGSRGARTPSSAPLGRTTAPLGCATAHSPTVGQLGKAENNIEFFMNTFAKLGPPPQTFNNNF